LLCAPILYKKKWKQSIVHLRDGLRAMLRIYTARDKHSIAQSARYSLWWKYFVLMYTNEKMRPVETIPRMVVGGIKENDGRGEFNYGIFKKNFYK
jgi:hypothetical protein